MMKWLCVAWATAGLLTGCLPEKADLDMDVEGDVNVHHDGRVELDEGVALDGAAPQSDEGVEADTAPPVDSTLEVDAEIDAERDAAPEIDAEWDAAFEIDAEQDAAPEIDAERDAAPEIDAERDAAPEIDAERDATPEIDAERDATPESDAASEADSTPLVDAAPDLCEPDPCAGEAHRECVPETGECACGEGFCDIGGVCFAGGTLEGCGVCDAEANRLSWTPRSAGEVCREAATACDIAEVCDGFAVACPEDTFAARGDGCDDEDPCTVNDQCDGAGACISENRDCLDEITCASRDDRCVCLDGTKSCMIDFIDLPDANFIMDHQETHTGGGFEVNIASFEISKTEITMAQYMDCVREGSCTTPGEFNSCNLNVPGRDHHPANCVSWGQAREFAIWVGGRLPTEVEWEYAARSAGLERIYPWGMEPPTCARAIFSEQASGGTSCGAGWRTWPVCSKSAGDTDQGLCDMSGNVWEWVEDLPCIYPIDVYGDSDICESNGSHMIRGGSYQDELTEALLVSARQELPTLTRTSNVGFRVARGCGDGFCQIEGACVPEGTIEGCGICDASADRFGWTPRSEDELCRPARGACDLDEVCDGSSVLCPEDLFLDQDQACDDLNPCTTEDRCDGAGVCVSEAHPCLSEQTCAPSEGVCGCVEGAHGCLIGFVELEGGTFVMDHEGVNPEGGFEVSLAPFKISSSEVTVAQYAECVSAGDCTEPDAQNSCNWGAPGRGEHPINCVDWDQARAFAAWAGARLPTEAEWEYAARSGGLERRYPWGDGEPSCDLAIFDDQASGGTSCGAGWMTWPVCSKRAGDTDQGVCDMAGNVWEWVEDAFCPYPSPGDGRAASCEAAEDRVIRGGSYQDRAPLPAGRSALSPSGRTSNVGFRLVKPIEGISR